MAQAVKNLPAMWETWLWSLGWEDPLEKGKATQSSNFGLENSMDSIVHGVAKSRTWLSHFTSLHKVKGFRVVKDVNEAGVDVFLKFSCFFYDPVDVGNLVSGFSAFSKPSLYIWKFSVHMLLKPSLKDFDYNLPSMGNEHNSLVVWTLFSIVFLWDWNEKWLFPVLWPLLGFPNLLAYWVQHFNSTIF